MKELNSYDIKTQKRGFIDIMELGFDEIFHEITLQDMANYKQKEREVRLEAYDYLFTVSYVWKDKFHSWIGFMEDCLIIKYEIENQIWFSYPISPEPEKRIKSIKRLLELCENEGITCRILWMEELYARELAANFKNEFELTEYRNIFDYVYERERLASLAGKKLAAKRNHIHRFEKQGAWVYEEIGKDNRKECWELELNWLAMQQNPEAAELLEEKTALKWALDSFDELGLNGGLIRRDGRVLAFSIGERLNQDTFVIHFEKAYGNIQGAYQIINQQMALHNPEYLYINRQEDVGDFGLRKSKLSYYPDIMIKKYMAVKSGFNYASKEDHDDIRELWEEAFDDTPRFIEMYLSFFLEKNRILCIRKDNRIITMASVIPATIRFQTEEIEAFYLYAVATAKKYRGQGFGSSIVKHLSRAYRKPLIVHPGEPSLEVFYEDLGFKNGFASKSQHKTYDTKGEPEITFEEITEVTDVLTADYAKKREKKLWNIPHVSWSKEYLYFVLTDHLSEGRKILRCRYGYILAEVKDSMLEITETTVDEEYQEMVIQAAAICYDRSEIVYKYEDAMLCMTESVETLSFAGEGYISLTLAD